MFSEKLQELQNKKTGRASEDLFATPTPTSFFLSPNVPILGLRDKKHADDKSH
jgi:hypothetical protein